MHALVVYDSCHGSCDGDTKAIATAVAIGIATRMTAQLTDVATAPAVLGDDIGLLIVGATSHGHGPATSGESTLQEWLAGLAAAPRSHVAAAAFEARVTGSRPLEDSMADEAEPHLRRAGIHVIVPMERFLIGDQPAFDADALLAVEVERARCWGQRLAAVLPA